MIRSIRTLLIAALTSAVIFAGSMGTTPAHAQKKDSAPTKPAPAAKPGKIEFKEGKDEKFRFKISDPDGKFLVESGPFKTKEDAIKGVETLKQVLANTKVEGAE